MTKYRYVAFLITIGIVSNCFADILELRDSAVDTVQEVQVINDNFRWLKFNSASTNPNTLTVISALNLSYLTLGSALFIGPSGLVTEDNANFFWDDSNNRLGIGTSSPAVPVEIFISNTGASFTAFTGLGIEANAPAYIHMLSGNGSPSGMYMGSASGVTAASVLYAPNLQEMEIRAGGSAIATFQAARMGIENSDPTYTLDVTGVIKSTGAFISGNVGIGTDSPVAFLHVVATGAAVPAPNIRFDLTDDTQVESWIKLGITGDDEGRFEIRYVPANDRIEFLAGSTGAIGSLRDYMDFNQTLLAVAVNNDQPVGDAAIDFISFSGSDQSTDHSLFIRNDTAQVGIRRDPLENDSAMTIFAKDNPSTSTARITLGLVVAALSDNLVTDHTGSVELIRFQQTGLDATSATTISSATTVQIDGPPEGETNVTLDQAYSLYVKSGQSYFGGNVGIGTTTPKANLHVSNGDSATTASIFADDIIFETAASNGLSFLSATDSNNFIAFGDSSDNFAGSISFRHAGSSMVFTVGGTFFNMMIQKNGGLHILPPGLSSFADVELEVSDGATIGAGTAHAASFAAHSSEALKSDISLVSSLDYATAYTEAGRYELKDWRYKIHESTSSFELIRSTDQPMRRSLTYESAPEFIKGDHETISLNDQIAHLQMALKQAIEEIEKLKAAATPREILLGEDE